MAEYCTRNEARLKEEVLRGVWAVHETSAQLTGQTKTLIEKLVEASEKKPFICGGRWAPGAERHLQRNGIPTKAFCDSVLRAVQLGARRDSNVACIGEGGVASLRYSSPWKRSFLAPPSRKMAASFPWLRLQLTRQFFGRITSTMRARSDSPIYSASSCGRVSEFATQERSTPRSRTRPLAFTPGGTPR